MSNMFSTSTITVLDDDHKNLQNGVRTPTSISTEKPRWNGKDQGIVMTTSVLRINEAQLMAATGGAEMSCYRCAVPFGVVILITGIVVTAVAYTFNTHGSTISVLGLVLLSAGLGLLGSSAVCWSVQLRKKRDRWRESQATLMASQGYCTA